MNEHPKDLVTDSTGSKDSSNGAQQAGDALRNEYLNGADGKSPNQSGTSAEAPANPSLSANDQRKAQEQAEFLGRYESHNFDLGPFKKGWGPYQALREKVDEGKIELTDEQILKQARRIRDRDFSQNGRDYYKENDQSMYWTQDEIDHKVQAAVDRVKGIDVSHGNKDIDWQKVKDAGYQFVFLKASEGITITDDHLQQYRKGALDAGLRIGYYHYFRPNDSVDAQVKNFVNSVGKVDDNALRLVVDTEDPKIWKPYSVAQRDKMIDDWCKGVERALGVKPQVMIYGSPDFFNNTLKNPAKLGKYDLWLADYTNPTPPIPAPWKDWQFFQYSEHGKVPGINTEVDLDMYKGDNLDSAFAGPKSKTAVKSK